ncbi:hypothetical protein K491DRAFT_631344, partial [Lophiostoma macrostomum CBS 122681]
MLPADQDAGLAGWYSEAPGSSSSEEILQTTFSHAKLLLRSTIKPQEFDTLFPPATVPNAHHVSDHSISDVEQHLRSAQSLYECRVQHTPNCFQAIAPTTTVPIPSTPTTLVGKSESKARLWLLGLSEKIVHYGNVFDVLVQHHPEYVSLAWGTFKLVFIAITNHAETASKLSKAISQIADLLPQQSLLLILYPTPQMQTSVARLYAHILSLFLSALKWYKDSRAVHAFKSIFQPWDLKFRQEYEAIASETQQICRLADVAMKAEVRDTRLEVAQATRYFEHVRREINELKVENQRLQRLCQSRFDMIENSLQFCRTMRKRHRDRTKLPLPDVKRLETWSAQSNNAILFIDTYIPRIAKIFMVDLIDLVLDVSMPIVWALRYADYWDQRMDIADVIRILILQAMQVAAESLLNHPFPVTVEQLRDASSLDDWVAILECILSGISHAFLVLDPDLL